VSVTVHTSIHAVPTINLDLYLCVVDIHLTDSWGIGCYNHTETDKWAEREAIDCCLSGLSAEQAADKIGSNWEPADGRLPWSGETRWHDGM
jgi:hypothetical protein